MKIGIIGNGFVGKATYLLKNKYVTILSYDINPKLCKPVGTKITDLKSCDIIFISVPTPMNKDGSVYLNIVESVVNDLKNIDFNNFVVVRSTVPPGTCDSLNVYFMPEFLTEKNYENDFINNNLWIFGLLNDGNNKNEQFKKKITQLIDYCYREKCIKNNNIQFLTNKEAELVKYFRNTFLAVKISYCNEIYNYCQKMNINYENVRNIATKDKRIGTSHSFVPGHDGKFGYGGTCFPKDINGLLYEFKKYNIESHILKSSCERNENIDRKNKDWEKNKGRSVI